MARSPADATRFTATGPHAHSKFNMHGSSASSAFPPPSHPETPQEKVNRLRNAARQAKLAKESRFDKVTARGRVWADRAHRITALTLIAATGIAGVVTVFALGDMIVYNRKKRKEFFAEKEAQHAVKLERARDAATKGTASDYQKLLLNRERAAAEAEQERLNNKGYFAGAKDWLYSGLKKDDVAENSSEQGNERADGLSIAADAAHKVSDEVQNLTATGKAASEKGVLQMVQEKAQSGNATGQDVAAKGGYLDRLGQAPSEKEPEEQKPRSWTSWLGGR
ncbi:hypothetical protein L228DRAFT_261007 [Xylona heveae TC161]|uniref:Cytochrome oxidase c assembly-domain-containing protein n=1 Tax=Xylona heveae (strain CBS 132557 / TC161) TaxID=1328760 RepID=A0A165H226_XYLHT|nr:hypothetical protein L228DRAFT_261007 [Xylona heveae TC161]KZF22884.1 hypothetical protein L228DRAFT_261007 [Xylona heveae TC161]